MWQTISQPLTGNVGDSPDAATFIIFYQEVFNENKVRRTDHSQGYSTKILNLQALLGQADNLRDEILTWYTAELKSYDYRADAEQELFDPGTGTTVEGISELAIMEALSELQIFNEVRKKNIR